MPLAHGARITYLPDLTGDTINQTLKHGKITAIVGVPALWETLRRRVLQRFSDKSEILESAVKALADVNFEVRARTGLDLGMLLFLPVHEKLGGRIRYMISGGSALPRRRAQDVLRHGLRLLRGLRLDRDRAGAVGQHAQAEADRRFGGATAGRRRGEDRPARRRRASAR